MSTTTIEISKDLHRKLKMLALKRDIHLKKLVDEILKSSLDTSLQSNGHSKAPADGRERRGRREKSAAAGVAL